MVRCIIIDPVQRINLLQRMPGAEEILPGESRNDLPMKTRRDVHCKCALMGLFVFLENVMCLQLIPQEFIFAPDSNWTYIDTNIDTNTENIDLLP